MLDKNEVARAHRLHSFQMTVLRVQKPLRGCRILSGNSKVIENQFDARACVAKRRATVALLSAPPQFCSLSYSSIEQKVLATARVQSVTRVDQLFKLKVWNFAAYLTPPDFYLARVTQIISHTHNPNPNIQYISLPIH